eukprot:TRINITY_DN5102_c0_g1_i4.p1 TRINITY_DN5102_c0_g1~~TRINITY_DN5102_c0_g1_i4.p1  ORF type:complete len:1135 (-),score=324.23 TRINITY_DN5102_c0_g1_i4:167-3571(-)
MASKTTPLKAALAAGEAAAKAAAGKSKAEILKKVANAATEAAIGEEAPPPLVARCVAEAVKKAGGSKHEAVVAAANAAVCSHPGLSRIQMTEEVFHRWDADKGGTLEFEEIIGHYMGASNHTDAKEAQVRAGFEKFIVKHGKKKGDSMDMTLFKKWMSSATMLQVTFQYLQSLSAHESLKRGSSFAEVAKAAAAAATAAGGDANAVAGEAAAVAMKLKASGAEVAKAAAMAAASAGASDEELAKISEAAAAKAGGSKEDAKKASLAAVEDIKANPVAIKKALAAGKQASEAAKSKPKAQMLKAVADAATQAAMAEGASQPIVAQAVAEAVKKAGGSPHDAVTAAANAAVCAHAGLSREQMTQAVFHRWDEDKSGTLEFEEVIGHYMGASNHSDAKEAQVRAGFEKFIVKNGKQKGDPMDLVLFKKWMSSATVLQVTFQYLQSLETDEAEALGASASMVAQAAAAAAKAAGGDANATADEAAAVAMKLKASPSDVANASAKAASSVGASEEQLAKIAAGAFQKAGGSKEDLESATVAAKSYAAACDAAAAAGAFQKAGGSKEDLESVTVAVKSHAAAVSTKGIVATGMPEPSGVSANLTSQKGDAAAAAGAFQTTGGSKEDLESATVAVKSHAAAVSTKGTVAIGMPEPSGVSANVTAQKGDAAAAAGAFQPAGGSKEDLESATVAAKSHAAAVPTKGTVATGMPEPSGVSANVTAQKGDAAAAAGAFQKAGASKEDLESATVAAKSYAAAVPTKGTVATGMLEPSGVSANVTGQKGDAAAADPSKDAGASSAADVPMKEAVTSAPIVLKDLNASEMKQEFENKFLKLFDKHSAGKDALDNAQVQAFVSKLPPKSQAALGIKGWKSYLKEADLDGDGKLDRFEFQVFNTHRAMEVANEYTSLFEKTDADKDGYLTKDELTKFPAILGKLSFPNANAMLQKVDKDGDGKISKAELMHHVIDLLTAEGSTSQDDQANSKQRASVTDNQPSAKRRKSADQTSAPGGKRQVAVSDDGNKCWDFMAGRCWRGEKCHYFHDQASRVSDSELEEHRAACSAAAEAAGLNLSEEAFLELQTLEEGDAVSLIDSLANGSKSEKVRDKNDHLIHAARRKRATDGKTEHPDWAWFGKGKGKRRRWA